MSKIEVNQISSQCGSTLTIGQSGDTVTLAAGATQSGFGRTGTVDWDTTAKTGNFTAVNGTGYFVNTTSGAITVTLPAGSAGAIVSFADYTNTWQTNAVTITPNGSEKIGGVNANATLSTQGQSVTFVYVDATEGWKNVQDSTSNVIGATFITATGGTITTCGNYKIHTFTSPGTFCVSSLSNLPANNSVDYLVVAGGGGGGRDRAGGGGGGGFRESSGTASGCYSVSPLGTGVSALPVSVTGYPITVGAGGGGGVVSPAVNGLNGSNSVFSTITSTGGGGGMTSNSSVPRGGGNPGGSGGGGGGSNPAPASPPAGAGNTPPVSPPQGQPGGEGQDGANSRGAGGGGATAAAANASTSPASATPGGAGATTSISGTPTGYAGGGGATGGPPTTGGTASDGGGAGGSPTGTSGTANTGGGGGGSHLATGASGGSGIVIIRYKYQ